MTQPHLSTTGVAIVLAVVAAGFYGLTKLYGSWVDEKRHKVRDKVKAREDEGE